ncbi:MAG: aminoacyl-tRNA hydrolase [Parcubacteria group bacterium]|nr:aminoacyl-tRNA hydrolase [Parcubacteria group bacterium]
MNIIVGLGNPGEEYSGTRHNTGRIMLEYFAKKNNFPEWEKNKKINALVSTNKIGKDKAMLVLPETFMNKSGGSLASLITSKKKAAELVVIYDDLDLPIGKFKISFNRSSGGHRGLQSIIKKIKTEAFVRIRVGISPLSPTGKLKKPKGDTAVGDFILGEFREKEIDTMKAVGKKVADALVAIVSEGREKAMGEWN